MVRGILAFFYQYFGSNVESDNLGFGHKEQHDKLLAHNSQRLIFSTVCRCYKGNETKASKHIIYHMKDGTWGLPELRTLIADAKITLVTGRSLLDTHHKEVAGNEMRWTSFSFLFK